MAAPKRMNFQKILKGEVERKETVQFNIMELIEYDVLMSYGIGI